MNDMRGWRLTDQLEVDGDEYHGDVTPPKLCTSADWFNPTCKPDAQRPATVTLADAWQEYMSDVSYGPSGDRWLSQLEHEFGEGITPEMASSLMSVFIWFGTGVGFGTLQQSFSHQTVGEEFQFPDPKIPLYGYWTDQFFGRYSYEQGNEKRLKSRIAEKFNIDHFTYFIMLLDFLSTERGAHLVNSALVRGGNSSAIKIRKKIYIWMVILTETNADGSPKKVYALEKGKLTKLYKAKQRSGPPEEIVGHTSLDERYYVGEHEITLV